MIVNAYQLSTKEGLTAAVEVVEATGLDVFVGVIVPRGFHQRVLLDVNDALADVVGRLGHLLNRRRRTRKGKGRR